MSCQVTPFRDFARFWLIILLILPIIGCGVTGVGLVLGPATANKASSNLVIDLPPGQSESINMAIEVGKALGYKVLMSGSSGWV